MKGRRDFLKGTLAAGAAIAATGTMGLRAASSFPAGLVYTQDAPGRWKGREGAHVPKATVSGGSVKIVNTHPVTPNHFIVKHTLLTTDGKVLGEKVFTAADTPESAFPLPEGFKGTLWVSSFCNLHDLWVAEFAV